MAHRELERGISKQGGLAGLTYGTSHSFCINPCSIPLSRRPDLFVSSIRLFLAVFLVTGLCSAIPPMEKSHSFRQDRVVNIPVSLSKLMYLLCLAVGTNGSRDAMLQCWHPSQTL